MVSDVTGGSVVGVAEAGPFPFVAAAAAASSAPPPFSATPFCGGAGCCSCVGAGLGACGGAPAAAGMIGVLSSGA